MTRRDTDTRSRHDSDNGRLRVALFEAYDHVVHGNARSIELLLEAGESAGLDVRCFLTAEDKLYQRLSSTFPDQVEVVPLPEELRRFGRPLLRERSWSFFRRLRDMRRYWSILAVRVCEHDPDVWLFNNVRSFYFAAGAVTKVRRSFVIFCKTSRTSVLDIPVLALADRVAVISRALWQRRSALIRMLFSSKLSLVPIGVPQVPLEERLSARRRWGVDGREFWIGMAGSVVPAKGPHHLIESIAYLRARGIRARGVIWGATPKGSEEYGESLERLLVERGVSEYITLAGWHPDVRTQLSGLDLYVLPSESEGVPRSIVEALMAGVPVIAADVGGIRDLVRPTVGMTVATKDLQHLGAVIKEALDKGEIRRWRAGAERFEADEFSITSHVVALRDCLRAASDLRLGG